MLEICINTQEQYRLMKRRSIDQNPTLSNLWFNLFPQSFYLNTWLYRELNSSDFSSMQFISDYMTKMQTMIVTQHAMQMMKLLDFNSMQQLPNHIIKLQTIIFTQQAVQMMIRFNKKCFNDTIIKLTQHLSKHEYCRIMMLKI